MSEEWNDSQPIYRQLRDRVIAMILDSVLKEGDPLPSVRTVAADYRVNPLTVLKAYQQLADEQIVEKRRGIGMFVKTGVRQQLLRDERQRIPPGGVAGSARDPAAPRPQGGRPPGRYDRRPLAGRPAASGPAKDKAVTHVSD